MYNHLNYDSFPAAQNGAPELVVLAAAAAGAAAAAAVKNEQNEQNCGWSVGLCGAGDKRKRPSMTRWGYFGGFRGILGVL